jgi:hypothetical protein
VTTEETTNPFETTEAWEPFLDRYIREEGNYVFEIKEAEDQTSSGDNPQIFVQLEAPEGTIRDWVTYNSEQLGKVVGIYKAAGVRLPQPGEFDPSDKSRLTPACIARLVGRKVGGVVRKEDSYKDPTKTILRIQGYVQPGRITDDIPADTRGLPDMTDISSSARPDEPDVPF